MHLTDCFMQLVAYVVYFQQNTAKQQPPFETVKADIKRLLSESEAYVKKGLFTPDDHDQARFVICAWVDEVILGSAWEHKHLWQREQLQRFYYNTTDAGEEVFERLNALGFHQQQVREVYYLCLALGFKGRFIHHGDEYLLEQLKTSNLKLLLGSSVGVPSLERAELFPEAYPSQSVAIAPQKRKFRFSIFTLAILAGPVLLFGSFYLIYRFILNGIAENFLRMGS
jgi:type VI secretion system protein ImpK